VREVRGTVGDGVVAPALEIDANVRVGIFVQKERRGRVLEQKMQKPHTHPGDFRDGAEDFTRHQMETAWARFELDDGLMKQHDRSTFRASMVTL
jgi:hypothetical protein